MEQTGTNADNAVKEQYITPDNLVKRISIHEKYSTNKTGFGIWIFSNYDIHDGDRVLELGCGTGDMWTGRDDAVNRCSRLVLSDLSEGMLAAAKEKLAGYGKIEYGLIDIQDIPYPDDSFDAVIANMMLYHVPDIGAALREVRRVLRSSGKFYCATYGERGIVHHLSGILGAFGAEDVTNRAFTLQNGARLLSAVFDNVQRLDYADSLAVTDVNDLIDYIYSLMSMTGLSRLKRDGMREALEKRMENGVLNVPKEYGMFVCT